MCQYEPIWTNMGWGGGGWGPLSAEGAIVLIWCLLIWCLLPCKMPAGTRALPAWPGSSKVDGDNPQG